MKLLYNLDSSKRYPLDVCRAEGQRILESAYNADRFNLLGREYYYTSVDTSFFGLDDILILR